MKQCDNCGIEMEEDALVCPSCGQEQGEQSEKLENPEQPQNAKQKLEEDSTVEESEQEKEQDQQEDQDLEDSEEDSSEVLTEEVVSGPEYGEESEQKGSKSRGKTFALVTGIVAAVVIVGVIAALIFLFIPKSSEIVSDPVIYRTSDNSLKMMSNTLKEPVVLTQDSVEAVDGYGRFSVSKDHKYVAYINSENFLYSAPIFQDMELIGGGSDHYLVSGGATYIFDQSDDGKYVLYQDEEYDLYVYNGETTQKLDSMVGEAVIARGDKDEYVVYQKMDDAMEKLILCSWKIGTDVTTASVIEESSIGFIPQPNQDGELGSTVFYLASDDLESSTYDAYVYDLETDNKITAFTDSQVGALYTANNGTDIIYSSVQMPEDKENENGIKEIETGAELHTLYKLVGDESQIIIDNIDNFYFYDQEIETAVYRQKDGDKYNFIYHELDAEPQIYHTSEKDDMAYIILDDKFENLLMVVFDQTNPNKLESTQRYSIADGKLTDIGEVDPEAIFVHDHTVGDAVIYARDIDEETGNVKLYSSDSKGIEEIDEEVYISSIISDYSYKADLPFLYITDVDFEEQGTTGTLKAYTGKDEQDISEDVWIGGLDYTAPIFYYGDNNILYMKDYDEMSMSGTLYSYDISKQAETVFDTNVAEIY